MKNLVHLFNPCISAELSVMLKEQIEDNGMSIDEALDEIDNVIEDQTKLDFKDSHRIDDLDEMFPPNDGTSKIERRLRRQGYRKLDDETPKEWDLCVEVWDTHTRKPKRVNIKRMMGNDSFIDLSKRS